MRKIREKNYILDECNLYWFIPFSKQIQVNYNTKSDVKFIRSKFII